MQLYNFMIEEHVKSALKEDIGYSDISTLYMPDKEKTITVYLNTRVDGILCGIDVFATVFQVLSKNTNPITIEFYFKDGDKIKKGDKIAKITGPAEIILTAERTALNYIQRLSGIATTTSCYVDVLKNYKAKIVDTRKTTPNFRYFEKYAVKTGGASLHRFNLCDCVMLKDNHIALAGSIKKAVEAVKNNISHAHKLEVECDTLDQVKQALEANVDIIMLDNMTIEQMKTCVELVNGKAIVEASGNVTLERLPEIAATGVDIISSSAIVAKAPTLDLGLDF